jgi:glycerol-3-phosphate O-acyltransferase / dihydroxyacetone phosphate acyltransferase
MLYTLLKAVLRLAVRVFYKEVQVQGNEQLPEKGPLIVAVNHPNTLMDPIVVALLLRQRTGFLANGGIFANALLKWVFAKLHLIPVYRPQDVKEGQPIDNRASFQKSYDYLLKGGTIMIFPEGSSVNEMKLRTLKTGTARIALETAAQQGFASGLRIAPVALTYSDPTRFHSRLYIRASAPIAVDSYATAYAADPVAAVHALTDQLRQAIQQNMIALADREEELLHRRISKLYREQLEQEGEVLQPGAQRFRLEQQLADAMAWYRQHQPQAYARIHHKTKRYFELVEQAELKEGFFAHGFNRYSKLGLLLGSGLLLVLLSPLYVLGLLTNYLPYRLPSAIASGLGTDIEYRAGIMMLSGLLLFPLYYAGMALLFYFFLQPPLALVVLIVLSMPLLGYFTLWYGQIVVTSSSLLRYLGLRLRKKNLLQRLAALRKEVKLEIAQARAQLAGAAEPLGQLPEEGHAL